MSACGTNDNWITLRVTDRAGNTTTTNFNVVLDYGVKGSVLPLTRNWCVVKSDLCPGN
jgi:hypothetical protein